MDGTVMWTDSLPDEVIELMTEQIYGHWFECGFYEYEHIKNNLKMHFTEYIAHGTVWTWDEVGEDE